jgi:hypothetical protein
MRRPSLAVAAAAFSLAFSYAPSAVLAQSAIEWSKKNSGNGHWYAAVHASAPISWLAASEAATARGGYLATPTSAAENDFILSNIVPTLGSDAGFGPILGGRYIDGSWRWVTGEAWKFTAWQESDPAGFTIDR